MPKPEGPRDDAFRTLGERADALEKLTARPAADPGGRAVDQAYRMLAELIGGVLVGLALGFGVDKLVPAITPWGLIAGVLAGFAVSVWLARRTANRLMAQAAAEQQTATGRAPTPAAVPFDDDDDE